MANTKNATVGSALIQVRAMDEDVGLNGAIRYRLKADPAGHWKTFELQPLSGILELRLPLDRKRQKIYDVSLKKQFLVTQKCLKYGITFTPPTHLSTRTYGWPHLHRLTLISQTYFYQLSVLLRIPQPQCLVDPNFHPCSKSLLEGRGRQFRWLGPLPEFCRRAEPYAQFRLV
ncbi:unnamed protein product [Brassicogethes aeneus]|uniref:Cadherin domain-containing protein n=1 Tax=Brassicogethes aeneus TaxID=1431903 RepID=A0A9P0FGL9_BRAAE|nr:unnamed protein product [Brassicogethes aeneus]